jgi:hypothetical protein
VLLPHQRNGISQEFALLNVARGKAGAVRMRWKVSYQLGGQRREQQGEISGLGDV